MKTVVIPGGAGGGSKKYELVSCEVHNFKEEDESGLDGTILPSETILKYYYDSERNRVLAWTWFSMLLVSWLIFFLVRMR
jgi:hypothetical protein